jgi:hypothetical protein
LVDDDSSGIVRRRISAFVIGNLEPVLHAVPVKSSKANDHQSEMSRVQTIRTANTAEVPLELDVTKSGEQIKNI